MRQLLSQMIKLPMAAFVFGMEMFAKMMRDIQKAADQGVDAVVGGVAQSFNDSPSNEQHHTSDKNLADVSVGDCAETTHKEGKSMPDTHLSDDKLKLVRYKVLFVKRDYETAFPEHEELVSDNMSSTAYTAWKVAQFIQDLDHIQVPAKWFPNHRQSHQQSEPPDYPSKGYARWESASDAWYIHSLPEDDKKYLRVYYEVLERYEREKFKYEERQIEVLEEIRDKTR